MTRQQPGGGLGASMFLLLLLILPSLSEAWSSAFGASLTPRASRASGRATTGCRSWVCGLSWLDQEMGPNKNTRDGVGGGAAGDVGLLGSKSLGLDWGHKKIGVGLSAGFSERPLGTIQNTGGLSENVTLHLPTLDRILMTARGEGATRLVIGNPLYRNGTLSPQAKTTRMFGRMLANRAVELRLVKDRQTPFVYLWDERLTSQAARVNIKIKTTMYKMADVDSQAACLILQDFYRARGVGAGVVLPDQRQAAVTDCEGGASLIEAGSEQTSRLSRPPASPSPPKPAVSYREWIDAERQRYAGDATVPGQGGSADGEPGTESKRKSKKKKKSK